MHSTLKEKQADDPHDILVVAPDAARAASADEELSNLLQAAAARFRSDPQAQTAPDVSAGVPVPPVDTTFRPAAVNFRPAAVNDVRSPGRRRWIGRGALRAVTALLLAACIGGAAMAWHSSGTMAKQMIGKWAPQFVLTSLFPPEQPALSAQPAAPAAQAEAANALPPQPAPPAQPVAEDAVRAAAAAPAPAESAQSLQSLARDLASATQEIEQLKASIEQLKASQQQMSRDVAKASEARASEARAAETKASEAKASEKASEQNLRPRPSAVPPPRAAAAPARQPLQPNPPRQTVAAPPRQPEPQSQIAAEPQADPELAIPRPPMPLR